MKKLLLLIVLSSCNLTKMSPQGDLDYCACDSWKNPVACEETCPLSFDRSWWEEYGDLCLNNLEEQAIENNFDLNIAATRVLQARALAGIAFSDRLPHISLDPCYTRQDALMTLSDFGIGSNNVRVEQKQISFPFGVNYEIDFWGKYRNLDHAARERLCASEYNQIAVFVALTADVASFYFQLRTHDEEIRYLEKAVRVREDFRDINVERLKSGLDSEIDVTRAELDLALAVSNLEDAKRLRGLSENAIALLLGYPACAFSLESGSLPCVNLCPPPGLPSTLVTRRPDVQQKMHLALAALDDIGAAKADFFPQFSITGALGSVSPTFGSWFTWQSRFWSLAVCASQVIFDGGRVSSKLDLRKAEYLEHIYDYRKQIATAFTEVEDALNEIQYRQTQVNAQKQAVFYSEDTSHLARNQYDSGLINYLLVADAEKTELNTRRAYIRLHGSLYQASIQLVKALGGGFNSSCCL